MFRTTEISMRAGWSVIRLENRQLSLDTGCVWIDYIAFYRVAHLPDATQASLQMAVSRYQGHFLTGESESWILSFQERLHLHYLNMSEQLGLLLERNNNWAAAARHYLKAIENQSLITDLRTE